jgi:hypothetical protein
LFAPVLSRLLVAWGAPKLPPPSAGSRRAPPIRRGGRPGSAPRPRGLWRRIPRPSPQSQFFSRSYESILPTSLIYIVLSTRGCSPWRPDAVMSTTGQDSGMAPPPFQGPSLAHRTPQTCDALPATGPYLRMTRFQGRRAVKKKRELFPGPPPASAGSLTLPSGSLSQQGNLNPLPFRWTARIAPFIQRWPIS